MTPFSAFATTRWEYGPESLVRYNGSAAYEIQGENASGASSGTAMSKMEQLANNLPSGTTWAWSGLSLQEKLASGQAMSLYALSILVVGSEPSANARILQRYGREAISCRSGHTPP
jgi:multidrug efflux pump